MHYKPLKLNKKIDFFKYALSKINQYARIRDYTSYQFHIFDTDLSVINNKQFYKKKIHHYKCIYLVNNGILLYRRNFFSVHYM